MYKLTDTMVQNFEKSLFEFHKLFQGGRCQAWQLEELLAKAIRSDFSKSEKVIWKGNGHDIDADIIVNNEYSLQIKSGKIKKDYLTLSGHRLGRFKGNFQEIIEFLNSSTYFTISVPYHVINNGGITHIYDLFYIEPKFFNINGSFESYKKNYCYTNEHGVIMIISPSMSWQIWWYIPLKNLSNSVKTIKIN